MKSAILYPYGTFRGAGCCRMLHAKHLALTSAVYTLVSFLKNLFLFNLSKTACQVKEAFPAKKKKILLQESYFISLFKGKCFSYEKYRCSF